jgi:hypothetical protein
MNKAFSMFTGSIAVMFALTLLSGCAATGTSGSGATAKQNRFLSKPELLVPVAGGDGGPILAS